MILTAFAAGLATGVILTILWTWSQLDKGKKQ